jgi:hypothetical protein
MRMREIVVLTAGLLTLTLPLLATLESRALAQTGNPSLLNRGRIRTKPKSGPSNSPTASTSVRPSRRQLTVSMGVSSLSYTQTGVTPFGAILITPKLDFRMPLGASRWSIGANAFGTALSLSSEFPAGTTGVRFIGVNWRLGYRLTNPGPWVAEVAGGTYFDTMVTSGAQFGYQNLVGPQLLLRVGRALSSSLLTGYGKYALMSSGFSFAGGSSQMAFGLSWAKKVGGGQLAVLGDFAQLSYLDGDNSVEVNTLSLGTGYIFSF